MESNTFYHQHKTNSDYYKFLKDLPMGSELYNCVIEVETIYSLGCFHHVKHSARLFFECFMQAIKMFFGVDFVLNEYNNRVNYSKTLEHIFNESKCKDKNFYKNYDLKKWYKDINQESHYDVGMFNNSSKAIQQENKELLYLLKDVCFWYYNKTTKDNPKKEFADYNIPKIAETELEQEVEQIITNEIDYKSAYERVYQYLKEEKEKNGILKFNMDKMDNKIFSLNQELNDAKEEINSYELKVVELQEDLNNKTTLKVSTNINPSDYYANYIAIIDRCKNEISELKAQNETLINEKKKLLEERDNFKLAVQNENVPTPDNNTEQNEQINTITVPSVPEEMLSIAIKSITYMNNIGCYATMNTLFKFFKGIDSPQTEYYPRLKNSEYWGAFKNSKVFDYEDLEPTIDNLIMNKRIITTFKGYRINKKNVTRHMNDGSLTNFNETNKYP